MQNYAEFCAWRGSATDSGLHGNITWQQALWRLRTTLRVQDPWRVATWGPARSPPASPAGTWCPPWCPRRRTSAAPSSPAASAPCTESWPGRTPGGSPSRPTSPGGSVAGKDGEQIGSTFKAMLQKRVGFEEEVEKQVQTQSILSTINCLDHFKQHQRKMLKHFSGVMFLCWVLQKSDFPSSI